MPTLAQSISFRDNINSYIALVFVGSFALAIGLIVWHAAVGNNPIADFIAQNRLLQAALQ